MLRTRDKTCARRCRFGHPARNNETRHSAVFAESRRDKTSLSGRLHRLSKRCSYAPASFEVERIIACAGGVVSSGLHTPGKNLSLREIFPEVPGAPAGGGAKGRPSRAHFHRCACACSTARRRAFRTASLRRRCLPTSRRAQRALFEELGRGSMGMNEFHYSINISFVPALSPVRPRFVPGSHYQQSRMATGFWPFVPVSPALLAFMVPKEMHKAAPRP